MADFKVLCNGEEASLPRRLLNKFQMLSKNILDLSQSTENIESIAIDPPMELDCSTKIFDLIIEWLNHHENDEDSFPSGVITQEDPMTDYKMEPLTGWDKNFIDKLDRETFYTLVVASNELEVTGLTTMLCREMANRILVEPNTLPTSLQFEDCVKFLMNAE